MMYRTVTAIFVAFLTTHCGDTPSTIQQDASSAVGTALAPAATIEIGSVELQPLAIHLKDYVADPTTPQTLPEGAVYNNEQQTIYWLPKKGQAGTYPIELAPKKSATVTITPVTEEQLHYQGPPVKYHTQDVGFVFLHGFALGDQCNNNKGYHYWGGFIRKLLPETAPQTAGCYDGGASVGVSAIRVAQQIVNAPCGTYNRCMVLAHSMGNLIMEYIFTHDQGPTAEVGDLETIALFKAVKDRVFMVVSVASAAGGSRSASISQHPERYPVHQRIVGSIAQKVMPGGNALRDLDVERATRILAPYQADTEVPFFMIAGYSVNILQNKFTNEEEVEAALAPTANFANNTFFNGSSLYATMDRATEDPSRFDGAVSFRSSCGIETADENAGPAYGAPLIQQFDFCARAPKKKNHYLWFTVNLNHSYIKDNYADCSVMKNPCVYHFLDHVSDTLSENKNLMGYNVPEVVRQGLIAND